MGHISLKIPSRERIRDILMLVDQNFIMFISWFFTTPVIYFIDIDAVHRDFHVHGKRELEPNIGNLVTFTLPSPYCLFFPFWYIWHEVF